VVKWAAPHEEMEIVVGGEHDQRKKKNVVKLSKSHMLPVPGRAKNKGKPWDESDLRMLDRSQEFKERREGDLIGSAIVWWSEKDVNTLR